MWDHWAGRSRAVAVLLALAICAACDNKKKQDAAYTNEGYVTKAEIVSPVGFLWKWEGTQTPVETITPADPTLYTLEFLPDTSVVVQIDCNRGRGKYKMDGKSIAIGPLAVTRMACPPGSLDAKFAQQLEAARTIFFRGDTLFMDLFADSGTMKFSQLPEPVSN